ncbi:hydantoinase B/oxoprolinase family protein [Kineobactrum salinum]|uniref:Hydantoinase B/oxoprolinase family protein n=1 Tax=Kineobactrum salinum TaxID=2708301 RepID=A0A6C0U1U9_9GAMM|nr:hydantoinase B/oxoprolinase family protein [Kineobactrum salinum]QIB66112.1 hydantoinase B/oxoprolinase family protein [Kineobactrum salinum]
MNTVAEIDIITTEIIRSGLVAASEEMAKTLVRTAFNPVLYDIKDFGMALISAEGELWSEAPGCVIFGRSLPSTIRNGLNKHGADGFRDGDVLIVNDPYETGTHLADTTIYIPIFHDTQLIAFAASTAHWIDLGGITSGGVCPFSKDIYQEGLCFQHQKLYSAGLKNQDLMDIVKSNVRIPLIAMGDMNAQIAACRQGVLRVKALCARYSPQTVTAAMSQVIQRTDQAMRRMIRELDDGSYTSSILLDAGPDVSSENPELCLQVTIVGDEITIGFDGTSAANNGPLNLPKIGAEAEISAVMKSILLPDDASNEGHTKALTFTIPDGLMVSPQRPTPVDCYAFVAECLFESVLRIFSGIVRERCPAGGYQLCGIGIMRTDPKYGEPFVLMEPLVGGNGALPHDDGPTMMFIGNGDVPNLPTEVLENRYPLRVERYELLPEAAGWGKYRGGCGLRKDYRVLEDGVYLLIGTDNSHNTTARGLFGGEDGEPNEFVCWPRTDKEKVLRERVSNYGPFSRNDLISVRSGGGGGWGQRSERDPQRVISDVRNQYLDVWQAEELYGIRVWEENGSWRSEPIGIS